jgi:hypothetical protein
MYICVCVCVCVHVAYVLPVLRAVVCVVCCVLYILTLCAGPTDSIFEDLYEWRAGLWREASPRQSTWQPRR